MIKCLIRIALSIIDYRDLITEKGCKCTPIQPCKGIKVADGSLSQA